MVGDRALAACFTFFRLGEVAAFFQHATEDPILSEWTDGNEVEANRRYAQMVPDDSHLVRRFEHISASDPTSSLLSTQPEKVSAV